MRIDKYLWCTRYFKTRNIATQVCKKGAVKVNNETVKPSREVFPGESITVRKDQIHYTLEVIDIPESRVGAKLVNLYRIDTTPPEAFKNQELLKYSKEYYRKKGVGRPTKKDRRDLEGFTDTTED
jgi:ribosome-associated heat shock protein Hsp15